MEWQLILALALAIPIITLPVLLVWYLNTGGALRAFQSARLTRRAVQRKRAPQPAPVERQGPSA